jgi:perosamine synthetase
MNRSLKESFVKKAKTIYSNENPIMLHRPIFEGNERNYLLECIDSNYVSSVGSKVNEFEESVARFTGSKYAIATVNGTAALHSAITLVGVKRGDEVLTQALTFIATCNAIDYCGARPIFIDVDKDTMGMSPKALTFFLETNAEIKSGKAFNRISGKAISACVPMHTFGFPCHIEEILEICNDWKIPLVEDAAESLGSFVNNKHTGTFGKVSTLSFNGNKLITTGGGGMLLTDDLDIAKKAKHITTTAKVPHPYEFIHDEIGYNYRLPNLNASLGCAQMQRLEEFLLIKEHVSREWKDFFERQDIKFMTAVKSNKANHWLNTIILNSKKDRDNFLEYTNKNAVMTRPVWRLMSDLEMFKDCFNDGLKNSKWLQDRIINIPSSVPNGMLSNRKDN